MKVVTPISTPLTACQQRRVPTTATSMLIIGRAGDDWYSPNGLPDACKVVEVARLRQRVERGKPLVGLEPAAGLRRVMRRASAFCKTQYAREHSRRNGLNRPG